MKEKILIDTPGSNYMLLFVIVVVVVFVVDDDVVVVSTFRYDILCRMQAAVADAVPYIIHLHDR